MQKLIGYIKGKGLTDPSMVNLYDLICSHPDQTEDILLMGFTALYETNKKLAAYAIKSEQNKKAERPVISDALGNPLSSAKDDRK